MPMDSNGTILTDFLPSEPIFDRDLVAHWAEQFRRVLRLNTAPGRDQSTALTKIDEAEMWALRSL